MRRTLMAGVLALPVLLVALPAFAGWTHDVVNGGVPVGTGPYEVSQPASLPDGAGGTFLAWSDARSGIPQVYAQHLNAYGVAQWAANGVLACPTPPGGPQYSPVLDTDGAGGIIVAWADNRASAEIYAQHFSAAGAATWGATGLAVCSAIGQQTDPSLVSDDAGGAYVAWVDGRPSGVGVYYNHVYAGGSTQYGPSGTGLITGVTMPVVRLVRDGAGGMIMVTQLNTASSDLYAIRQNNAGYVWGNYVCTAAGDQVAPAICSDGAGGAIVTWTDKRTNLNGDIYAQRLWYQGSVLWAANGVQISTGATTHMNPQIVADNVGGAIVTWNDLRSGYAGPAAQRVTAGGSLLWTSGGVLLSSGSATLDARNFSTAGDGLGGLLVSYADYRTGGIDTWAQRVSAAGATQWGATGVAVNSNPSQDNESAICPDGRGGAIVAFIDGRTGPVGINWDLFASHLDSWGILGAEPAIAAVKDVPNDNGGHVKVSWYASPLEADPLSVGVTDYLVFRSAPPNVAAQAVASGRISTSADAVVRAAAANRPLLARPDGANTYFWELVATQSAYHLPTYSVVAPTTGDSMAIGNPKTAFLVEAHNWSYGNYWASAPDSGYSTDNVPPIVPAPFAGTYFAGSAALHWNPNPETDIANYRLYRGTSPSFVTNPASLVASPADTGFVDAAGAPYWYKLTAVDIHGNESPAVALLPLGTTGVDGAAMPRELALAPPSPNPARGSARIAFALPAATHVRLTVFDAGGRRVRVLADGELGAGTQSIAFDMRDDRGNTLRAGLYLVRLDADGRSITRRFAAVR